MKIGMIRRMNMINIMKVIVVLMLALMVVSCAKEDKMGDGTEDVADADMADTDNVDNDVADMVDISEEGTRSAYFAGGCFWCMESDFEKIDGVIEAISGFSGGDISDPSYEQVSSGTTGHREAVRIIYDPETVSYTDLLSHFWVNVDPLDGSGQFCDKGFQYTSAIFYTDEDEKDLAEETMMEVMKLMGTSIRTEIEQFENFYEAEEYHQDYYKKNSLKYKTYRRLCRRDARLESVWADKTIEFTEKETGSEYTKPSDEELMKILTPLQYEVTQEDGTERPFDNEYWNNTREGIYVDILSGEPLFSSKDKYVSGTGWPSFVRPLEPDNIIEKADRKFFILRTEIRSSKGDNHIGHVFNDGPEPTGLRYCMNSAALRFIPKENLEEEGYGQYLSDFE